MERNLRSVAFGRSVSFANEFGLLADEYRRSVASPEVQNSLKRRSIETVTRFISFISEVISDVLNAKAYFIVETTFLDNILTTANYFKYALVTTTEWSTCYYIKFNSNYNYK